MDLYLILLYFEYGPSLFSVVSLKYTFIIILLYIYTVIILESRSTGTSRVRTIHRP